MWQFKFRIVKLSWAFSKFMVPSFEWSQAIWWHWLLHLLHAIKKVIHINFPQLHRIQWLDLIHLQFSDRSIGSIPEWWKWLSCLWGLIQYFTLLDLQDQSLSNPRWVEPPDAPRVQTNHCIAGTGASVTSEPCHLALAVEHKYVLRTFAALRHPGPRKNHFGNVTQTGPISVMTSVKS